MTIVGYGGKVTSYDLAVNHHTHRVHDHQTFTELGFHTNNATVEPFIQNLKNESEWTE